MIWRLIAAAVVAGVIGLVIGFYLWGRPMYRGMDEVADLRLRQAEQATQLKRLTQELESERDRRQKLEEVISQGKK
jgi:beta-lactam-binding protein with PASTA domain